MRRGRRAGEGEGGAGEGRREEEGAERGCGETETKITSGMRAAEACVHSMSESQRWIWGHRQVELKSLIKKIAFYVMPQMDSSITALQ